MKYYPVHSGYPPYTRVNPAIEAAFAEHGRGGVQMPPKVYVTLVENGDFRTMPAYIPALGIAGVKADEPEQPLDLCATNPVQQDAEFGG